MLRLQLRRMLQHDPGARIGDDPEDVHQLRVAIRRSRAFLRAARPLLEPEWEQALQAELRWLGNVLGAVRDHDVILDYLLSEAEELEEPDRASLGSLFERIGDGRAAARVTLLDALGGTRYLALLDRLEEAGERPHVVAPDGPVADLWLREWRRLRRAVDALESEPSDEDLHRTRIRAKRARYAAELAMPALRRRGERFVARAKGVQDVLGEHQDAVVAEERLRALLGEAPGSEAAFAAGRLVERQRARRAAARAGFPDAWDRLERAGRRAASS
jgi:CHAD domain-containing protein